jgi:hypothetical protein
MQKKNRKHGGAPSRRRVCGSGDVEVVDQRIRGRLVSEKVRSVVIRVRWSNAFSQNTHDGSRFVSKSASPLRLRPILMANTSIEITEGQAERRCQQACSSLTCYYIILRRSCVSEAVYSLDSEQRRVAHHCGRDSRA